MDDLVKTLSLIAGIVVKEDHEVLDREMTAEQQIAFVNACNTLSEHSRHIQSQVV